MNLLKNITIRERVQVQISVTADNVLNRVFFTDPDGNLSKNINNTNFGQFTATDYGARLVILNMRINF